MKEQNTPTPAFVAKGGEETEKSLAAPISEESPVRVDPTFSEVDSPLLSDDPEEQEEAPLEAPEDPAPTPPPARTISQRILQKRMEQDEERLEETERIRQKYNLSKEDIVLAIELGYEDDLCRMVGYENYKKLKRDYEKEFCGPGYKHYRTAFGYTGEETINHETAPAITARYEHDRKHLILRTVLTSVAAFVLLFLDYPKLLGGAADAFLNDYPFTFPILSFLILLSVCALSFRQINAGLRSFLKAAPTPYSVPATTLILVIIYDVITLFFRKEVLRVNMLACMILVVLALCDIHRLVGEIRSFRLLALVGEKTVLEPIRPRKRIQRRGKRNVKVINDAEGETIYRISHTNQITGFFRRFNTMESANFSFQALIGIGIACATVIAFLASFVTASLAYALSTFVTVLFLATPTTAMFCFFHPLQRANKVLVESNCVLVGNEGVAELAESQTLVFEDTDLFRSEKRAEITVKDGDDLHHDLKLAGAIFRKLGGTLDCLADSVGVTGREPTVSFLQFADNGLEARVDGQHRVLLGSTEYLRRRGVRVPEESADRALRRSKEIAHIHVAVDRVLKFTYELEYMPKLSFEMIIEELAQLDTAVAIQSYDPAINDDFLLSCREGRSVRVHAIKPGRFEGKPITETADTGAVALGHTYNILCPIYAAREVRRCKRFGMKLQILVSAIGILATALFVFFPEINLLTPISVTLYHGAAIVISWLYTHLHINRGTLRIHRYF